MESENKNKIGATRKSAFERIEKIHPVKMLLYLCLIGVGVMFLIFLLAFARSEAAELQKAGFSLPKFFSLSLIFLFAGSYVMYPALRYYRKDNLKKLSTCLGISLGIGFCYLLTQAGGWYEMANQGLFAPGKIAGNYLFLITVMHALHIAGGIVFLMYYYFTTLRARTDVVRMLVFIRNPFRRLQLSMLQTYWNFMAALWAGIYVFLLFSF